MNPMRLIAGVKMKTVNTPIMETTYHKKSFPYFPPFLLRPKHSEISCAMGHADKEECNKPWEHLNVFGCFLTEIEGKASRGSNKNQWQYSKPDSLL
jgi:hypothetical protein